MKNDGGYYDDSLFNKEEGQRLAELGMRRAYDRANREDAGWGDKAYADWLEYQRDKPVGFRYTAEDVRRWSMKHGKCPEPSENRAWGQVATRAKNNGLIVEVGVVKSQQKTCHRGKLTLWEKL